VERAINSQTDLINIRCSKCSNVFDINQRGELK
jgi:hypothetical protein